MNYTRAVTLLIHIYLLRAQSACSQQQELQEAAPGAPTTEEPQATTNQGYVSRVNHYGVPRPTTSEPDILSATPSDVQATVSTENAVSRQPKVSVKYVGSPLIDRTTTDVELPDATSSIPDVNTPEMMATGKSIAPLTRKNPTTAMEEESETSSNTILYATADTSKPKVLHVTWSSPERTAVTAEVTVALPEERYGAPEMTTAVPKMTSSPRRTNGQSLEPKMLPTSKRPTQYKPPYWNVSQAVSVQKYERYLPKPEVGKKFLWSQESTVFLTPYIEQQKYNEARQESRIEFVDNYKNPSYSGYLTINATCNSNLFFWFFPAKQHSEVAPVILWMAGGPGDASLLGAFGGVGPVTVNENLTLEENENSLTSAFNLLFIDIPVGTGYSYGNSAECNARSSMDVADQLYQGLMQFFTIFFDLHDNGFFIAAEGHASTYACTLGYLIHFQNAFAPFDIRFSGIIGISPIIDYLAFVNVSEQAFSLGLISEWERNYMRTKQSAVIQLIHQREYSQAMDQFGPLFLGLLWPHQTAFQAFSGLKHLESADDLSTNRVVENAAVDYLNLARVRRTLRVPTNISAFEARRQPIVVDLYADVMKSYSLWAEFLLNSSYKFLLIHGQLDLLVSPPAFEGFVDGLNWRWRDLYRQKTRFIWEIQNGTRVAGYGRKVENLATMDILASGHRVTIDQPGLSLETIKWFINNEPLGGLVESNDSVGDTE